MNDPDRRVRKFVFDYFLEHAVAPAAPEIAAGLGLELGRTREALQSLDRAHHIKLLEGTYRILMAFPFSALATPFRVTRTNGTRYFANCAWDSIAFHPMLNEPLRVDSYCDRCGKALAFRLEDSRGVPMGGPLPIVVLELPAREWWQDITRTCANTMVFLGAEETKIPETGSMHSIDSGQLTVDQVVRMSGPIYSDKLRIDYDRPASDVIQASFDRLGLKGPHWKL